MGHSIGRLVASWLTQGMCPPSLAPPGHFSVCVELIAEAIVRQSPLAITLRSIIRSYALRILGQISGKVRSTLLGSLQFSSFKLINIPGVLVICCVAMATVI